MLSRHATLAALVAAALAAGACGGDDDSDTGGDQAAQTQTQQTTPPVRDSTPEDIAASIVEDTSERPELPRPGGTPPDELETLDIVEGEGDRVQEGDRVTVDYVGANWSNGEEFDASWNGGEPFTFEVGGGQVIPGWEEGVAGMRRGGRRLLIIPPDLGYGPQGQPPTIPPNETLMFVVDVRRVR